MANDRGRRNPPDDVPDADPTILQPQAGHGGGPGPDRTVVQGDGGAAVEPGATLVQQAAGAGAERPEEPIRVIPAAERLSGGGPRVFAGRFEIADKLGEGGMGVVYRAHDREIEGREIALKMLRSRYSRNAKFRELFFREIHAAQGFVSEHVVQVRDTGKAADGTLFLTMDLIDGEPLDTVLAREGALNERHALEVARQTLLALGSGHEQGFVHRDVKPSNVMLANRIAKTDDNPFGVGVRVLDFGIAGLTAQVEEGQIIGTPRYMSPEQVQGQRLDARSDLFTVGILLYEMLSGNRPFDGSTVEECRTSILETDVKPMITELDHLSDPIRKLLRKALQKNRDKRFQSAAEFVRAIEKSRAFRERRGMPAWAGAVFMLGIAAVGGLGWMVWDQRKEYDRLNTQLAGLTGKHAGEIDGLRAEHQASLDSLRSSLEQMRSERDTAMAERATALLERDERKEDYTREVEKRRSLENRLQEVEDQLNALGRRELPAVKAAGFFDDVVTLIEGERPDAALAYMRKRADDGEVDIPEAEGAAHVAQVVEAAAAIDAARKALLPADGAATPLTDPVTRDRAFDDYRRGARKLVEAHATAKSFELEAAKWIGATALGNEEPPDRLGALQAIRDRLDEQSTLIAKRIESLKSELEDIVLREREELMKATFRDDPAPIIRHMRAYSDDVAELIGLVDRLGAETEAACVNAGELNLAVLAASAAIPQWGDYLLRDGAGVAGKGADAFRWLWAARRWYAGEPVDGEELAFLDGLPSIDRTSPHADWRAQLRLQRAFAATIDSFLADGRGAAVYRQRTARDGGRDWYHELMQVDGEDQGTWNIVRKRIDENGQFGRAQSIRIALHDGVLMIADIPTLDVRALGGEVKVAHWRPALVEPLPDQAWARGMNHQRFAERIAQGLPCLVVEAGNSRYWFSPGHGLVRQEVPDVFERELCYSARVR